MRVNLALLGRYRMMDLVTINLMSGTAMNVIGIVTAIYASIQSWAWVKRIKSAELLVYCEQLPYWNEKTSTTHHKIFIENTGKAAAKNISIELIKNGGLEKINNNYKIRNKIACIHPNKSELYSTFNKKRQTKESLDYDDFQIQVRWSDNFSKNRSATLDTIVQQQLYKDQ